VYSNIGVLLVLETFGSTKMLARLCCTKVNKLFPCKNVCHLCCYQISRFYHDWCCCNKYM